MYNKPEAFIFDLDGTIYLGEDLIPGADKVLEDIRLNNIKIKFVTNNPRFSREAYANKLNNLGIQASIEEIITSSWLTANYLKKHPDYGKVFVVGEDQVHKELTEAGVNLIEEGVPDTVLVSFDTTLTYEKLQHAYYSLNNGANFIATNQDMVCPTPEGGLLDTGAIIAALETTTKRSVEKVIGKPSSLLGELLVEDLDTPAENCVVVGDRLNTDVRLGNNAGMISVWINSQNEKGPFKECRPDYIIETITDLPKALKID